MMAAQATLWRRAAVATAVDLRKRIVAGARDLRRASGAGMQRIRDWTAQAAVGTRRSLGRYHEQARTGTHRWLSALTRHRHGTWLLLFALLFTLFWLLAGWVGVGNGVWRGLLVGLVTPLALSVLFPLRLSAMVPGR
ncbi:MAG: hypothetical protein JWO51_621 [Rhodospirillales bacterium]|nr:hypothetical protein [Rhodospirillales bacterium]